MHWMFSSTVLRTASLRARAGAMSVQQARQTSWRLGFRMKRPLSRSQIASNVKSDWQMGSTAHVKSFSESFGESYDNVLRSNHGANHQSRCRVPPFVQPWPNIFWAFSYQHDLFLGRLKLDTARMRCFVCIVFLWEDAMVSVNVAICLGVVNLARR
ncbi:hypothetical protein BDN72DRAFT_291821 [Pluteus cervinus]|uniref:Uncharacterized protein n=1 Tax=Pluteus cervinus TaxID=181527 RepID=A0ACD3AEC2_9AGAR|nr:hypothetical protein BDN72DRAFT_291821 [Pluteus cervinus]